MLAECVGHRSAAAQHFDVGWGESSMKKNRFLPVLKIVLQMLLAIVTSLGTTLRNNSPIESSSQSSDSMDADYTTARSFDLGAGSITLALAA